MSKYLVVENWPRFQLFKGRYPTWICNYVELLHKEEYTDLTPASRAVLHGLWMLTAEQTPRRELTPGKQPASVLRTADLTRELAMRVTSAHIKALNQAGFIRLFASKPVAQRYAIATAKAEAEVETEGKGQAVVRPLQAVPNNIAPNEQNNELAQDAAQRLVDALPDMNAMARDEILGYAGHLPEAAFHSIREKLALEGKSIRSPVGYAKSALRSMVSEQQYRRRAA